jgi:hypothetical protein
VMEVSRQAVGVARHKALGDVRLSKQEYRREGK